MNNVPKQIDLGNGRKLVLWYATTHLTFHWGIESRWQARLRQEYVSQALYEREHEREGYTIMAYQQGQRPSAKAAIWGVYRVEAAPGSLYHPAGNFTLLTGQLSRREAFVHLPEIIRKREEEEVEHGRILPDAMEYRGNGLHRWAAHRRPSRRPLPGIRTGKRDCRSGVPPG